VKKICAGCGEGFEAKRTNAKYCSDKCRQRGHRRPPAPIVGLPAPGPAPDGLLTKATRTKLDATGRADTELGAAALFLAARLDAVGMLETGAGVAALMKEYRATLADALRDAETVDDELDQIRGSAALKLIHSA
jgi:hypothetical protein